MRREEYKDGDEMKTNNYAAQKRSVDANGS